MANQRKFKSFLWLIILIVMPLFLFGGLTTIENYLYKTDFDEEDEELVLQEGQLYINDKVYNYNAAIRNYLLIGTDASGNYGKEDKSDYQGNMADVLLLVVLNRSDNNYAVLEIDRNTVMKVPMMNDDGSVYARSMMPICTAHWYGGDAKMSSDNTVNAVSELLGGMPIDGYYELNMDSIQMLNHAIGGVTVTIESDFTGVDDTLIKGHTVTLNDSQAYHYVHDRIGIGSGLNEERMIRQENYIKAFLNKLIDKTAENPGYPNELFGELKQVALTDMTGNDISRVLNRVSRGDNLGIVTFDGEYKVGNLISDGKDHQEFYIDKASYYEVMDKLYKLELVK